MKQNWQSIVFLAVFMSAGCHPEAPPSAGEYIVPVIIPKGDEAYLRQDSDVIYDQGTLHTFELWLPESSLSAINADPSAEQYVAATLIFRGDTISPAGLRYKGSIGAFAGCLSGSDWGNPSGYKTCSKLSMQVKINWESREETFYDLKKLQFHSMNLDPSQMRERLGYWFFRQMGVVAPRSVHARVMINGRYSGLYALTEEVDGRFTGEHFSEGDGNLYKEIWPVRWDGRAYSEWDYISHLETNEDTAPDVSLMRNFGLAVESSTPSTIQGIIETWMDVDNIITYAAIDRTIRADDGPFHWYCDGNQCSNHNYYWYETPTAGKLHLIPWDMDNAFENIISNVNPVTPIADEWGQTRANCSPFPFGQAYLLQRSAACDKLTAGWASYTDLYEQKRAAFKSGPLSKAQVEPVLQAWTDQIREATLEAHNIHPDAPGMGQWEAALLTLRQQLTHARLK
jgi:hypothetical protein